MPWSTADAQAHTHKASTEALKALWAKVANESLARGDPEAVAIRKANAAVAREAPGGDGSGGEDRPGDRVAKDTQSGQTRRDARGGLRRWL